MYSIYYLCINDYWRNPMEITIKKNENENENENEKMGFVKLFWNEGGLACWRDDRCPTNFVVVKYIGK